MNRGMMAGNVRSVTCHVWTFHTLQCILLCISLFHALVTWAITRGVLLIYLAFMFAESTWPILMKPGVELWFNPISKMTVILKCYFQLLLSYHWVNFDDTLYGAFAANGNSPCIGLCWALDSDLASRISCFWVFNQSDVLVYILWCRQPHALVLTGVQVTWCGQSCSTQWWF